MAYSSLTYDTRIRCDPKYQHIPIGQLIMQFGEKQYVATATAFLEDENYK